jgi:hypothetical protein
LADHRQAWDAAAFATGFGEPGGSAGCGNSVGAARGRERLHLSLLDHERLPATAAGSHGRVDVERRGNVFAARTRGVSEFTLLVSPDAVDFSKPVQVTVNGAQVFSGPVKRDLPTLLKWASRDNDRTALYGAEIHITVPN